MRLSPFFAGPSFPVFLIAVFARVALAGGPTVQDAQRFMDDAEARLLVLQVDSSRANWVKSTYITGDTELLAAHADRIANEAQAQLVKDSKRFSGLTLPPALARKFYLLKVSLTLPPPEGRVESDELTRIVSGMEGT